MSIADVLARLLDPGSPWLTYVAVGLVAVAGGIAKRLWTSLRLQGARIGEVERIADSERTRRRQVESVLADLGVPLPYWPPDGPDVAVARRRKAASPASPASPAPDYPGDDAETSIYDSQRIPVPSFTASERDRLARHRRDQP